ncbi:ribonuclease 1-like [Mercurialis annua]|uniref:ribonuclease 1-like n=1 Tax=Mercurialis annua TaxID=3986 RepID=UPI00215E1252|nr:ribonuclease 1-like [Mercurialis annua]XP_050215063.1 ribonuclease 1-like [Mercurialis annua]XP_050215065.1 ribonuclease 1-like [Mercurialis annua]XP_050215067.1 ribonuclease 1-like [Mercurialis annua]XP_050215068.1 ribonuclease 1-like [Mercurialis annua]XP_050215069.1 ribonuclease 1-like [Mercurialis annua]XP_050215070.1 ribonuclease 1-like [Mercurialis annua]XP_050215071.1 ribonuclease 1-like [Mercurialis annua]XP_050215073.1 ribonuclease 1-like [Mercurialis annua]XP_050215074.1 ribon
MNSVTNFLIFYISSAIISTTYAVAVLAPLPQSQLPVPPPLQLQFPALLLQNAPPPPFDYMYLAMQWPPATCNSKPNTCYRPIIADKFTIHGLWPNVRGAKTPGPIGCAGAPFDITKLNNAAFKKELYKLWPSVTIKGTNEFFWEHEWKTHGTCSPFGLADYFETTLRRAQEVDLLNILISAGIKPDDSLYLIDDIKKALKAHNIEAVIRCKNMKGNVLELHEIRICVDKSGKHFEACDKSEEGCGNKTPNKIKFASAQSAISTTPAPPPPVSSRIIIRY